MTASEPKCDFCTRPGHYTRNDLDLRYCAHHGMRMSLVAMLEQKYGRERARELLEAQA